MERWELPGNRGYVGVTFERVGSASWRATVRCTYPGDFRAVDARPLWSLTVGPFPVSREAVNRLRQELTGVFTPEGSAVCVRLGDRETAVLDLSFLPTSERLILGPGHAECAIHIESISLPSAEISFDVDATCVGDFLEALEEET